MNILLCIFQAFIKHSCMALSEEVKLEQEAALLSKLSTGVGILLSASSKCTSWSLFI